ncbi:MAG: ATP-grasp domain-containing protein [Bacteroidota bacterium]
MSKYKILLTDISIRKVFDLYNLVRYCLSSEGGFAFLIRPDEHVNLMLRMAYGIHKENTVAEFSELLSTGEDIVFLPIEERTILEFYSFLEQKRQRDTCFRYLLPTKKAFLVSRDKLALAHFAQAAGIAIPKTLIEEAKENSDGLGFPLVAKKRFGEGAKGQRILKNPSELERFLHTSSTADYIVQEYLPGEENVYGAFFLYSNGELIDWQGHKRIRTFPARGGVSVFSTVCKDEELKVAGKAVLDKLEWSGLAMVEFILDSRDKKLKLIEVNPRIWGSILLSGRLVGKYIEVLLGRKLAAEPIEKEYLNWLFPGEVLHFLSKPAVVDLLRDIAFTFKHRDQIHFVNLSYSTPLRSMFFLFHQMFNMSNYKKVLQKRMR